MTPLLTTEAVSVQRPGRIDTTRRGRTLRSRQLGRLLNRLPEPAGLCGTNENVNKCVVRFM